MSIDFIFSNLGIRSTRDHKGKSLIDFPKDYTLIDIETTGLNPIFDEIIEIGAIKYRNNVPVDTFSTLIKPSEPIDDFIIELTGITNEMLENAPDIVPVLDEFYKFISNEIIVGYNVNFDINFLYDELLNNHSIYLNNNFVDVLRLARRVVPKEKIGNHKLVNLSKYYDITVNTSHRALADCSICNKCYENIHKDIIKSFGSIDNFISSIKKQSSYNISEITTTNTNFDESHPLFDKTCVFTGKLEKMSRKEAAQIVVNLGGKCSNSLNLKTNILILGNNDYCPTIKDGKSSKLKKAEELILKGHDILILSEDTFYDLILDNSHN
jgi:DNA polymerase-3 subunit epsilon